MSVRLYVGNLPKEEVNRDELHAVFADASNSVSTKVIKDRKTGKCRGFAFVTVPTDEQADEIIEKFNGQMFKDSALKIEKALPRSKNPQQQQEEEEQQEQPRPSSSHNPPARRNKKSRRGGEARTTTNANADSGAFQPDPRWAGELAKLKELLSAQASNP